MKFADLDRAARVAASKAPLLLRPDVYQSAWVRFLRYAPLTFGGAYLMGRHAMLDLLKRERKQVHMELIDIDVTEDMEPSDTAALIAELRRLCPKETRALLLYYAKDHHANKERVAAFKLRVKVKRKLKGK